MVIALGAWQPFEGADEVTCVGRIDPDVGFGVVLRKGGRARGESWVAADLTRVLSGGAGVLTRGRARAGGFPAEAVIRARVGGVWDLRPEAAGLRRGVDVLDPAGLEALRISPIRAGRRRRRDRERRDQHGGYGKGNEPDFFHTNPPHWKT